MRAVEATPVRSRTKRISPCRHELIEIQRSIMEKLKAEIRMSLGRPSKEMKRYLDAYNREFNRYARCSNMKELVAAARRADIVYNGDYHTLAQAQRIPLRILRELIARRPDITLAVELVKIEDQPVLDLFMAGELSEDQFLEAIDYYRTWGFPWENYRDLFIFAREQGIRVIGINTQPKKGRGALKRRDRAAARVIAKEYLARRGNLVYVFDGDLHVAPAHLPSEVDAILGASGSLPETVIVYQNNENIYWKLARKGLEQETDVVLISKNRFCVMSTPPMIKFQSYFNWIENTRELRSPHPASWRAYLAGDSDLYSQVSELVSLVCKFLQIQVAGLDDFVVYSAADLDFLDHLKRRQELTPSEVATIATHIRANESYFIEKGSIIYIANLSINHAAEEAAHFIHKVCAGPRRTDLNQLEDFYCRVMRETVGFFGSKIVNHKRHCYGAEDFRNLKRKHPTTPPDRIAELAEVGRLLRRHKRRERRFLRDGTVWDLDDPMYAQPLAIHIGLTHALGYMLGDHLFEGVMSGTIEKAVVRDLFFMNFSDLEESFGTYLDLISTIPEDRL